jgi:hypothetical protein
LIIDGQKSQNNKINFRSDEFDFLYPTGKIEIENEKEIDIAEFPKNRSI